MLLQRIALTAVLVAVHRTLNLADGLRQMCARVDHMMDCTHGHSKEMGECNAAQRTGYWLAGKLERAGNAVERVGHKLGAWVDRAQQRSGYTFDEIHAPLLR
jgi:hypothetical protein